MPLLSVQNLNVCIGAHSVVDDISFTINQGEVFGQGRQGLVNP